MAACDVFVSYAHVDDGLIPPAMEGWVTTLIKALSVKVAQKLGRREAFNLWIDPQLAGNEPLTPQILDRVGAASTMLLIYSQGYRASEWCKREKNTFLRRAGGMGPSRLFVVERDNVEREPELAGLRGFRFWVDEGLTGNVRTLGDPVPTVGEQLYYSALNDLATKLAREIQRQRTADSGGENGATSPTKPTIFLSEVTDDLDPLRKEVQRYLEQLGVEVVPNERSYNRTSAEAFVEEVDQDLQASALFVQLLSGVRGKKPADGALTFVELQLERSRSLGKPIIQWRDPALDMKAIRDRDPEHVALLQAETVLALGLEDFKRELLARIHAKPPPVARDPGLVFVNAEQNDLAFAQQLSQIIAGYGAGFVLPSQDPDPTEVRTDLEQNLLECDRLMIVYGATTPTWVRKQLLYARKMLSQRKRELQGLAVYQGPPPPKLPVGFQLPNQRTIDGSQGFNEADLRAFLDLDQ